MSAVQLSINTQFFVYTQLNKHFYLKKKKKKKKIQLSMLKLNGVPSIAMYH